MLFRSYFLAIEMSRRRFASTISFFAWRVSRSPFTLTESQLNNIGQLGGGVRIWFEPRTQTRDQRSALVQCTYRWRQSPQHDFAETSSRFATAVSKIAPYISRPLIGPPQNQASEARHGSGKRPTVGFPCSSAGSDHAGHDQSSAALPYFAISNAKTP